MDKYMRRWLTAGGCGRLGKVFRAEMGGFTMIELIVVIAIIAILAVLVTPRLAGRVKDAKKAAAMADMQMIANAMKECESDTGYIFFFEDLNDMPVTTPAGSDTLNANVTTRNKVYDPAQVSNTLYTILDDAPDAGINNWKGPYVSYNHGIDSKTGGLKDGIIDMPTDPWGKPYRLYVPQGQIHWFDGTTGTWPQVTGGYYALAPDNIIIDPLTVKPFDRFAIVSDGPNGVLGRTLLDDRPYVPPEGDDIVYFFN
jgi:prepilin-type N-terminal cleavage/methylation domain-containing protein